MSKIHEIYNGISNTVIEDKTVNRHFSLNSEQIVMLLMRSSTMIESVGKIIGPSITKMDSPINLDTMVFCFIGVDFAQRHARGKDSSAVMDVIDQFIQESVASNANDKYYYERITEMIKRNMKHIPVVMDLVEQLSETNRTMARSFMNSMLNSFIGGVCMGIAIQEIDKLPPIRPKHFKRYMDYLDEWDAKNK